jgi:hypothetical protein
LALRIVGRGMSQQKTDPTVIRYVQSAVGAVLYIVLVIAILNFFGPETTSLAALIAAGGGAIGLAWSGSLANFAAAVFMVILPGVARSSATSSRPSPTIRFRRVGLQVELYLTADVHKVIALLKANRAKIPKLMTNPAPDVEILTFMLAGRSGASCAALLPQQGLLAGLLRYQVPFVILERAKVCRLPNSPSPFGRPLRRTSFGWRFSWWKQRKGRPNGCPSCCAPTLSSPAR